MTYSINWPITLRSAVPFRSGNYIFPCVCVCINRNLEDARHASVPLRRHTAAGQSQEDLAQGLGENECSFNRHFPGQPWQAGTRMSPFWIFGGA